MAEQGLDLGVDVVGDVNEVVQVGTCHHPDLGRCMGFEALIAQKTGEGELVAGIGVDRRQRGLAGGEVIGVARIDPVEVANR